MSDIVEKLKTWRANRHPGAHYCRGCGGRIQMDAMGIWVLYYDEKDDLCDADENLPHQPESEETEEEGE